MYLFSRNIISYKKVIDWAYAQYTNEGIDPFIEKITLAMDLADVYELITDKFHVSGVPDEDFLIGEISSNFFNKKFTLKEAIWRVLYDLDATLSEEELLNMNLADDLFDWHDNAEEEALKLTLGIFNRYRPIYESELSKFKV